MARDYPDLVIVVPGLIGSVLEKDGRPLWGTSPGALWGIVAGGGLKKLALTGADNEDEDLGDGVAATALIDNVEMVPGLWKQGGYSRLAKGLAGGLALVPNQNYFIFPYDWRRNNRVSARKLAAAAPGWLKRWREKSGNPAAKIVLVVHSMGGLVARYFVECLDGWKITKTILSFGTPYKGSGNPLGFLCNGFTWKVGPVTAFDGTEAMRTFDSVYQLLPTYPFIREPGPADLKRVFELSLPNLDRGRAEAAHAFHEEIRIAQESNASSEQYGVDGPRVRPVIGTEQPTIQSAYWDGNALTPLMLREEVDHSGDGTVPRVSALPLELNYSGATYIPNTHSALQSDDVALGHMRGVLTEGEIDPRKYRAGRGERFSLFLDDAYRSSQPIRIEATTSDYIQAIDGVIERTDGQAAPRSVKLRPSEDRYRVDLKLDPGAYRVRLSAENFHPVDDVFLVIAD